MRLCASLALVMLLAACGGSPSDPSSASGQFSLAFTIGSPALGAAIAPGTLVTYTETVRNESSRPPRWVTAIALVRQDGAMRLINCRTGGTGSGSVSAGFSFDSATYAFARGSVVNVVVLAGTSTEPAPTPGAAPHLTSTCAPLADRNAKTLAPERADLQRIDIATNWQVEG